tara:strand:- start:169 stop:501 length:333 start_codon:yes stop_codon:yes gene_type:complete
MSSVSNKHTTTLEHVQVIGSLFSNAPVVKGDTSAVELGQAVVQLVEKGDGLLIKLPPAKAGGQLMIVHNKGSEDVKLTINDSTEPTLSQSQSVMVVSTDAGANWVKLDLQ